MLTLLKSQSKITRSERKYSQQNQRHFINNSNFSPSHRQYFSTSKFYFSDWRLFFHLAFLLSNSFVTKLKSEFSQLVSGNLILALHPRNESKIDLKRGQDVQKIHSEISDFPDVCCRAEQISHSFSLAPKHFSGNSLA